MYMFIGRKCLRKRHTLDSLCYLHSCSISALTTPIYWSIEYTLLEKTRISHLNFGQNCDVCHRSFIGLYVFKKDETIYRLIEKISIVLLLYNVPNFECK